MHGSLLSSSHFNHVILEKDCIGISYILVGVSNSDPEWCSPANLASLWQVILATSIFGSRGKHDTTEVQYNRMFMNGINMELEL